jgi:hypothetical protein
MCFHNLVPLFTVSDYSNLILIAQSYLPGIAKKRSRIIRLDEVDQVRKRLIRPCDGNKKWISIDPDVRNHRIAIWQNGQKGLLSFHDIHA